MTMFSELILTDGTTKIDLLNGNKNGQGFSLIRYIPGRPGLKGGGVWQDSPLAAGRQLVAGERTNTTDALTLRIAYPSHDSIIQAIDELDALLEKAIAYWTTSWQQTPVYLQALVHGETSKRYAVIHMAQYDQYFDPYAQPYISAGMHSTEEFNVGIERGLWLGNVPGSYTSVAIGHQDHTDAIAGDVGNSQDYVMIGNMQNDGLQYVFRFTGSFSSNLLSGSLPYALLGNPVAVGDILYLGADRPFWGLVFNLTVVTVGTTTIVWEFWNGSAWTTVTPISDATASFYTSGIRRVLFQESDVTTWAKTTVNSQNAYWYRARVSAKTGSPTPPQQGTRHIYATTNGYIDVAASQIDGTQNALMRFYIRWYPVSNGTGGTRWYFGLRSYDRGDEFTAYLGNLTVGALATANTANPAAPWGQSFSITNFSSFGDIAYAKIDGTSYNQDSFYGRFRMFVRMATTDNTGASQVRWSLTSPLDAGSQFITYGYGEAKSVPTSPTDYLLIDLGYITLPPGGENALFSDNAWFYLRVQGIVPSGKTLTIYDFILLPADEWTASIDSGDFTYSEGAQQSFFIDPISYPKQQRRAFRSLYPLTLIANGPSILHANARQRLWAIALTDDQARPDIASTVFVYKTQRYFNLRDD